MSHRARLAKLEQHIGPEHERCDCGALFGWVPATILCRLDETDPDARCPKCDSPLAPNGRAYPSARPGTHYKRIILGS